MEFNNRSVGGHSTNYNSRQPLSSSGLSYFAQRASRVGYMHPDLARQGVFLPHPTNVRDTVSREIEKQQIRQEIIAAEERRRDLEAEVRREMLMESEIALGRTRGLPFLPSLVNMLVNPMPILNHSENSFSDMLPILNHSQNELKDSMPFSRGSDVRITELKPTLDIKEIITFQPKPGGNVPGVKRKAETPSATSAMMPITNSKKKLKEKRYCELCQISATSELAMKDHLEGKNHKFREKRRATHISGQSFAIGFFSRKTIDKEEPKEEASEKMLFGEVKDEVALEVDMKNEAAKTKKVKKDNLKFKLWCEMCKIGAFSANVMESHIRGKKHRSLLLKSFNSKLAATSGSNSVSQIVSEMKIKN